MGLFSPDPSIPIATTTSLVASKVMCATRGVHYVTTVQIDATAPTAIYYVHIVQGNGANVPADGAYTSPATLLHAPIAWTHTLGTPELFVVNDGLGGARFEGGLCVILSTTQFTKTETPYMLVDGWVR